MSSPPTPTMMSFAPGRCSADSAKPLEQEGSGDGPRAHRRAFSAPATRYLQRSLHCRTSPTVALAMWRWQTANPNGEAPLQRKSDDH
eukprot:2474633-Pyramimonas_sp.AAC.1